MPQDNYYLVASVEITDIALEEDIDDLTQGIVAALPSMVADPMALQDYPDIPSEADDSYKYIGG